MKTCVPYKSATGKSAVQKTSSPFGSGAFCGCSDELGSKASGPARNGRSISSSSDPVEKLLPRCRLRAASVSAVVVAAAEQRKALGLEGGARESPKTLHIQPS